MKLCPAVREVSEMRKQMDFAYHLTTYLTSYMSGRKNFSVNTVRSYRDTFKLLLLYCREELRIPSGKVQIETLTAGVISDFLDWLRDMRGNSPSSVNQRLAAIHAFFKYLRDREPSCLLQCKQILEVQLAKTPKPMVGYLILDELRLIFAEADEGTRQGRRDLALMHLLYDSGARAQELCDVRIRDVYLGENPHVMLTGKGNKTRYVPIVTDVARRVSVYIDENHLGGAEFREMPLFFNQQRQKLSRAGIAYVIEKYADAAREKSQRIQPKVTPHIFRHSKAMHLCQAGIDIIYIRDILGHVELATTEIYAKMNIELMRDALEDAYPELPSRNLPEWTENDKLMGMLNSL